MDANSLIKTAGLRAEMPGAEALKELQKILKYNDTQPPHKKVRRQAVCDMLTSLGFDCGPDRLYRVCRNLGRKGYNEG
jgi:hypothetical protein